MVAAVPDQGGATWAVLQYVLGLQRLGHEVLFVEEIDPPGMRRSSNRRPPPTSETWRATSASSGSALLVSGSRETVGLPYATLTERAAAADVLLNISGMLTDEALLAPVPVRVYLDLDPAFIQLWHATRASTCASTATRTS